MQLETGGSNDLYPPLSLPLLPYSNPRQACISIKGTLWPLKYQLGLQVREGEGEGA